MIIGVDIGGTNIRAGIVSKGRILKKVVVETGKTRKKAIESILNAVDQLFNSKIKGIGIGVPGPADYPKGIIGDTRNIPLKGVNLKKIVSKKFHRKVVMTNDANCFTLGEAIRLRKKNVVGLTLGTGVGGGIVIDGKLYVGKGNAGELGHCTIKYDGLPGYNQGDLEAYVSAKAVRRRYGKSARRLSKKEFKEYGKFLGVGIANIANAFDPDVIVIGGGISNSFDLFKDSINKEISKRSVSKVKIVKGREDSGIMGASAIV